MEEVAVKFILGSLNNFQPSSGSSPPVGSLFTQGKLFGIFCCRSGAMKSGAWAMKGCEMFTVGRQKCNGFPISRGKNNKK
jgi:hypothetical protein